MTCGKRIYPSKKIARGVINSAKKHSRKSEIPKREYFCKECNGYHLTHLKSW